MNCTRCSGTGFLNTHQIPDEIDVHDPESVGWWIESLGDEPHDVQVCDCCGDGETWNNKPGQHAPDERTFGCM